VIVPRLDCDLLELLCAVVEGHLADMEISWKSQAAIAPSGELHCRGVEFCHRILLAMIPSRRLLTAQVSRVSAVAFRHRFNSLIANPIKSPRASHVVLDIGARGMPLSFCGCTQMRHSQPKHLAFLPRCLPQFSFPPYQTGKSTPARKKDDGTKPILRKEPEHGKTHS